MVYSDSDNAHDSAYPYPPPPHDPPPNNPHTNAYTYNTAYPYHYTVLKVSLPAIRSYNRANDLMS